MLQDDGNYKFHDKVAYTNVENSLEEILTRSAIVKDLFEKGEIGIVGGVYNVETGEADLFKNLTKKQIESKRMVNM
jgi:carbonic anhydrase